MDPMQPKPRERSSASGMESPFGTAAAQAAKPSYLPSTQAHGTSLQSSPGAKHPDYSSNKLSEVNETPVEVPEGAPTTTSQLASASSLTTLSPFANAPPLASSFSSSLANSTISLAVQSAQSDPRSQKSSLPEQSSFSSAVETPEEAAMAAAAAASSTMYNYAHTHHQRNMPSSPPSPFLNGHVPNEIIASSRATASSFNLFPVPEGTKEGQMSGSSDISTPHFYPGKSQKQHKVEQQWQQQLLQHLFPPNTSAGGAIVATPFGHAEPQATRTPASSPAVYSHPSGIPRQGSSSSNSALSSPPSPAAAAVGAAAGPFSNIAASGNASLYSLGGVQLSAEQFQKAALQAMQSGQSYASTLGGRAGTGAVGASTGVAPFQQPQSQPQPSVARNLMACYQQQQHQFPAVRAEVAPPPPQLSLQDAVLQALQQPGERQPVNSSLYSPTRRSDSWGQFRGTRSYPASTATTPPTRPSTDIADFEGIQQLVPAVRYSISRDSGGGVGSNSSQRSPVMAEQKNLSAALLLQRVQLSTRNLPKVRALLNTGGKFTTDPNTGNLIYEGGEVRLVSLPEGCTFPQLLAVLAKTERPGLSSSSSPTTPAAAALRSSTTSRGEFTSPASKDTSIKDRNPAPSQALSAATAAVAALVSAQETAAAAADDATAALDVESYATYAMHVARAHCLLRYQLPSDPSIFVDVVDDEDVQLMFEEIAELREIFLQQQSTSNDLYGNAGRVSGGSSAGGPTAPKLRLFVQWMTSPPGYTNFGGGAGASGTSPSGGASGSRNNTIDYFEGQFLNPTYSEFLGRGADNLTTSSGEEASPPGALLVGAGSGGSDGGGSRALPNGGGGDLYYSAGENSSPPTRANSGLYSASSSCYQQEQQQHVHIAHRSASELRLAAVRSDQLECIPASEVILTELLGTGTFGDMYGGKWRECTVAVKCLNPSAVGLNFGSQAAWLAFLNDANSTAALRHPNLVEVYGIVLPGAEDQRAVEEAVQQRSESLDLALKAAGSVFSNGEGGLMIDPKMSGRRTSWDFGAALHHGSRSLSTPIISAAARAGADAFEAPTPSQFRAGLQRLPGPCMSTPAMVMEYVSGKSLHGAIKRKDDAVAGALARVLYALDASRGMAYLHHRGISHFDLKSTNILLGWRNMRPAAKIAGYGLSNRKTSLHSYTPGVTMSPSVFPWVAPEILRNPDKVSHKVDVYSFGIVLWELWALRAPYEDMNMNKLLSLAVNTNEEVRPEVPPPGGPAEPAPGWEALVKQCWAEDPDERPEFVEIEKTLSRMAKAVKYAQRKPAEEQRRVGGEHKVAAGDVGDVGSPGLGEKMDT